MGAPCSPQPLFPLVVSGGNWRAFNRWWCRELSPEEKWYENWGQLLQGSSHISMSTLASVFFFFFPIGFSHKNRHLTILEDLFRNLSNCKVNVWSSLPLVSALQLWGTRLCFCDTTNVFSFHTWLSICEFIFLSSPLLFISFSSFRCCYYTFFSKNDKKLLCI